MAKSRVDLSQPTFSTFSRSGKSFFLEEGLHALLHLEVEASPEGSEGSIRIVGPRSGRGSKLVLGGAQGGHVIRLDDSLSECIELTRISPVELSLIATPFHVQITLGQWTLIIEITEEGLSERETILRSSTLKTPIGGWRTFLSEMFSSPSKQIRDDLRAKGAPSRIAAEVTSSGDDLLHRSSLAIEDMREGALVEHDVPMERLDARVEVPENPTASSARERQGWGIKRPLRYLARIALGAMRAAVDAPAPRRSPHLLEQREDFAEAAQTTPWTTAYRPSWVLPRRQSSIHIYVVMPSAFSQLDQEARTALDMRGNAARAVHPISLRREIEEGEPLWAQVELAGFSIGKVEPILWRPPFVRFVVSMCATAGIAPGIHRPLVTVRGSHGTLATFDFDLEVRGSSRGVSLSRLSAAGFAVAAAAVMGATIQRSVPPAVGWPVGALCVVSGMSALATARTPMIPAETRARDSSSMPPLLASPALEAHQPMPRIDLGQSDMPADVLIVTAVKTEYEAVLRVDTGAAPGSRWREQPGPMRIEVACREFATERGMLRIAVTQALGMGGVNAVDAAALLIRDYGVRCLAMCGVCAGRRGDAELGDVIIADRLWQYDAGKRKVFRDGEGQRVELELADIDMYKIQPPEWIHAAERFQPDPSAAWLAARPRSQAEQGHWLLERILRGADPSQDPEQSARCADYPKVLARLWRDGLLQDGKLELTDQGRIHIHRHLLLHRDQIPEPGPLKIHVGPIASGNQVVEDAEIFSLLTHSVRKVLGVEMEAAAIGTLAHTAQLPYSVVMKAVMDHADSDKSDNFKEFAARASAECLISFLRKNLPPRTLSMA